MSVEFYKKQLIDLRAKLVKQKESKKKDNEYYARVIKASTSASTKTAYRKSKVSKAASHDRMIESIKKQIETAKANLARARKK